MSSVEAIEAQNILKKAESSPHKLENIDIALLYARARLARLESEVDRMRNTAFEAIREAYKKEAGDWGDAIYQFEVEESIAPIAMLIKEDALHLISKKRSSKEQSALEVGLIDLAFSIISQNGNGRR